MEREPTSESVDSFFEDPNKPEMAQSVDDLFAPTELDQINTALEEEDRRLGGFDPIDPDVAEAVKQGEWGLGATTAKKLSDDSKIMRVLNAFTLPQEAVGRGMVKAAEAMNLMPEETAQRILMESDVSPSDFLNLMWKQPKSLGGKVVRGTLGFLSDVLLDPLGIVNVFSKTGKAGRVIVRGQEIDTKLLSAAERLKVKQAAEVDKLIGTDLDI